ncbi:MAG: hypothetical protein ACOCUI_02135 [bacterium]
MKENIIEMDNQQPSLDNDVMEGSTTISKESTGINNTGKRSVYLRLKDNSSKYNFKYKDIV